MIRYYTRGPRASRGLVRAPRPKTVDEASTDRATPRAAEPEALEGRIAELERQIAALAAPYGRFAWTPHNLIGHPLSEILGQLGLSRGAAWVHDVTLPNARPMDIDIDAAARILERVEHDVRLLRSCFSAAHPTVDGELEPIRAAIEGLHRWLDDARIPPLTATPGGAE